MIVGNPADGAVKVGLVRIVMMQHWRGAAKREFARY